MSGSASAQRAFVGDAPFLHLFVPVGSVTLEVSGALGYFRGVREA